MQGFDKDLVGGGAKINKKEYLDGLSSGRVSQLWSKVNPTADKSLLASLDTDYVTACCGRYEVGDKRGRSSDEEGDTRAAKRQKTEKTVFIYLTFILAHSLHQRDSDDDAPETTTSIKKEDKPAKSPKVCDALQTGASFGIPLTHP